MSDRASVSIRFTGNKIRLDDVTALMGRHPTFGYHKGETYYNKGSDVPCMGLTNLWMLDIRDIFPDASINYQIDYCIWLLLQTHGSDWSPAKSFGMLRDYVAKYEAKLLVSVYYFASSEDDTIVRTEALEILTKAAGGKFEAKFDRETERDRDGGNVIPAYRHA